MTRYALPVTGAKLIHARAIRPGSRLSACGSVTLHDEDVPEPDVGGRVCRKCLQLVARRSEVRSDATYLCPHCRRGWPTADAAFACCGDLDAYYAALNNALFQCHGDHLHRMKSIQRKLARDYGVRRTGVRWSDS